MFRKSSNVHSAFYDNVKCKKWYAVPIKMELQVSQTCAPVVKEEAVISQVDYLTCRCLKVKSWASILVNRHTGISLILFDNTNTEGCQGLELISLILSQHAEFVGLAGVLGPDSNELWTLRCSAHTLRLKPPELRCSNNSNPCGFSRLWIKQKCFLAKWSLAQSLVNSWANINKTRAAAHLQTFTRLQTNHISGDTSLIY